MSVIEVIKDILYTQKLEGAVSGQYKENIVARLLGLKDHTENSHTVRTEKPLTKEEIDDFNSKLEDEL